jgi:predicted metal-dependent phosphotriesterase family hydrolase
VRPVVRTVLGDVDPGTLGAVDYHEHLFQVTPLLPGDELDDEQRSQAEAVLLRDAGASAMVEATPWGLGRRPAAVARISAATGLHVVHATGAHREAHYAVGDPLLDASVASLTDLFAGELSDGMRASEDPASRELAMDPSGGPVRAGVLKAGIGYWSISEFERRVVAAVAAISAQTGAPVMVHLEHGSAAHEVLDLLAGLGCAPDRVVLAHVDRNVDPQLHLELARRGALLGYDGAGRHHRWPDSALLESLASLVAAGAGDRVVLGGDVARRTRYVSYGGMPGLSYLFDRFVPRLRQAVGEEATRQMLVDNAAAWLTWAPEEGTVRRSV